MFQPHFEILLPAQKILWPELAEVPSHFTLYGGTALALRLGHRESVDFDFFSSEHVEPGGLLKSISFLKTGKVLQNVSQTLTVAVNRHGPVKLSFFGGLTLGRVGEPDRTPDGVLQIASLLDLAGTKAAAVTQRAESRDYIDLLAIFNSGIRPPQALAAALAIYGEQYNPMLTLKSLAYFGDGDLHKLTEDQKDQLRRIASMKLESLPQVPRMSLASPTK
jgi:hypothetical protein